ncbi:HNH endonuclease [Halorussus sp. AFM4]|uniref:HNH endonuclease n=1 Tax=Halorussus sp. AFM4 TaxID=3421651 RepID=UPI003EBEFE9E
MTRDYPSDWDKRRKAVYRRDSYQCQHCGAQGGPRGNTELHAHHVVPKSRGGSHNPNNLTTLCQQCHSQVHGRPVGSKSGQNQQRTTADLKTLWDNFRVVLTAVTVLILAVLVLTHLTYLFTNPSSFLNALFPGLPAILLGLIFIWPSKALEVICR